MNQDKEELEAGIPLVDLPSSSSSSPHDTDFPAEETSTDAEDAHGDPAPEAGDMGLPSLFDEEELAEVGLKATPFDESDGMAGVDDDLAGEPQDDLAWEAMDLNDHPEPESMGSVQNDVAELEADLEGPDSAPPPPTANETGREIPDMEDIPDFDAAMEADVDLQQPEFMDLQHQFKAIQAQLFQLQNEFSGKIKYDAHKDQIIDKLHQELQEYKQDIVKKHILSVVLDVVKVADDIRKWIAYFRSLDVSQRDPVKLFRYLEAIPSDLEDIFYWQGVKPYVSSEGVFNPATQRAIKKIATDDSTKDKTVAKSIRPGYEWEGKIIRQEMVAVYVYEDDQESVDTRSIDE